MTAAVVACFDGRGEDMGQASHGRLSHVGFWVVGEGAEEVEDCEGAVKCESRCMLEREMVGIGKKEGEGE